MNQEEDETKSNKTPTASETTETQSELSLTEAESAVTESELSTTLVESGEREEQQKITKPKSKGGRPRKAPDVGLWAIRGVDMETRGIVEKAATRSGKTIGQFVNEDVRAYCQAQIVRSEPQLPASPRDLQVQVEQLTQMVEGIAARLAEPARKSFWQRVFGK
jgi:hypothetical protein